MPIKYELAEDLQLIAAEIAMLLFPHVRMDSVVCLRSHGSSSRGTIARCHALGKAMQLALGRKGFYVIEVISKRFDKMSQEEQIKTMIHELMHIPKSFGGGFKHHDYVCEENVDNEYQRYVNLKKSSSFLDNNSNNDKMIESSESEGLRDNEWMSNKGRLIKRAKKEYWF